MIIVYFVASTDVTQSPSTPDLLYHHRQHYQGTNYQNQTSPNASSTTSTITANHQLPTEQQEISSKTLPFPHAHFVQNGNKSQNLEDNTFQPRFQHSQGKICL